MMGGRGLLLRGARLIDGSGAPPVPDAPEMAIRASVTVGAMLSTVGLVVSAVVVDSALLSVAVTDTLRLVLSTAPAVIV